MSNSKPPKWADRFLKWYCNPRYFEEIQGEIHELFDMRLEEKGKTSANRSFIGNVFNEPVMLQHGSNPEWKIQGFEAIQLNELALRPYNTEGQ